MSNTTPKLITKLASKLARPTGSSQPRLSPTPPSGKSQGILEKTHRGLNAENYALKLPSKQSPGASGDAQPESASTDDYRIGERVWVAGAKPGIIAFIGEVQFGPGEWAGVVLDSPVGKNDGSVNGVRYFMCEPKRGIFSRLTKLSRTPAPKSESPAPSDKSSSTDDAVAPKSQPTPSSSDGKIDKTAEERTSNGDGTVTPKSCIPTALPRRLSVGSHSSQGQVSPSGGSVTDVPISAGHKYHFKVGDRVTVSGSKYGIIRYLGEADFAKGMWVGVELDEPLGKNDGSVAGKRYFSCLPMFGLFAPFHKVELFQGSSTRATLESAASALRRSSLQKLGYGNGMSRDRTGSQESISSIGSAASSASRSGRMRLGITSLATQGSKVRSTVYGATPTVSALQKSLKEKEEHVEQLLRERDVERADFIRTAAQIEDLESHLSAQKSEYNRYVRETEDAIRRLKLSLERTEIEKTELSNLLHDEKRKIEDLQFTIEEATIDKGDIETEVVKYSQKMKVLEEGLRIEKDKVRKLTQDLEFAKGQSDSGSQKSVSTMFANEHEDYFDQIEELTHKLFLAENEIAALQGKCTAGLCSNCAQSVTDENRGTMAEKSTSDISKKIDESNLSNDKNIAENKLKVLNDELKQKTSENESLLKQVTELSAERDSLLSKVDELGRENATLKSLMQEVDGRNKEFKDQLLTLKTEHETVVKEMQKKIQNDIKVNREQTNQKLNELEKENARLKTANDHLTVKDKEEHVQEPVKEGNDKPSILTHVTNQETKLLQQRIRQLEKALGESQSNSNLVNNENLDPAAFVKLKADKESAESQIEFLNSVIVEIQRKNNELETRLQAMDPSSMTSSVLDGYNTNGTDVKNVAPRLFCDICDVFDLHDTDDCPKQDMSNSPPASHHHGSRKEERPYCTTCERFGHLSDQCVEEQTF